MEFPFRKLPNRQTLQLATSFIPEADMLRIEAAFVWFGKVKAIYHELETNLTRFGLSFARLGVLTMLLTGEDEGMTPSELADRGGITRATVTGLLDGLEKDGLVERLRHPADRRRIRIRLTAQGRELVTSALPSHFRLAADLMRGLTEPELKQLMALMEKIGPESTPTT